jgi:uncharacterized Tic20 family protein
MDENVNQVVETGGMSKDERMWGMFCHLAALAGYIGLPFGNILGPLIVWLIKKDQYKFVDEQGKESMNFQITITIAAFIAGILCFILVGIPLLILLIIANLVLVIMAGIKANEGVSYKYPYSIKFIK